MRRLPPWMVLFLFLLAALMLYVGWDERHHVGYVPVLLGILWGLFALGAAKGMTAPEDH